MDQFFIEVMAAVAEHSDISITESNPSYAALKILNREIFVQRYFTPTAHSVGIIRVQRDDNLLAWFKLDESQDHQTNMQTLSDTILRLLQFAQRAA